MWRLTSGCGCGQAHVEASQLIWRMANSLMRRVASQMWRLANRVWKLNSQ
jgi:hypothetical protein